MKKIFSLLRTVFVFFFRVSVIYILLSLCLIWFHLLKFCIARRRDTHVHDELSDSKERNVFSYQHMNTGIFFYFLANKKFLLHKYFVDVSCINVFIKWLHRSLPGPNLLWFKFGSKISLFLRSAYLKFLKNWFRIQIRHQCPLSPSLILSR